MNPLQRNPVGNTDLSITALGLGGVFVGGRDHSDGSSTGYDDGMATLQRAWNLGVRYFDTAPFYGRGRSEVRFGHMLGKKDRSDFVLSSKVGRLLIADDKDDGRWMPEGIPKYNAVFDMSRDGILRAFEESLERLELGHIDIVYLHDPDWENLEQEALETAFPTLQELKDDGVIKAFGTGMNQWEMIDRFLQYIDLDVVLLAGRYTLLDQTALERFLPLCDGRDVSVVVGGPYNSGILAADDLTQPVWFNYQTASPEWVEKARRLQLVCAQHNVPLKAAALQFPLAHPAVASVIPGAASPAQMQENFDLMSLSIPDVLWRDLKTEGLLPDTAPCPVAD